ncbi:hypothetical protein BIW11_05780 [Tropilaelaps mercedesae]|uniref:Uncharacterized protein n=1 Tax=Tropilaelaps mercedesae TaxID=418985 RepID=A0A1V9Y100_9ACAR|nr:hypothetical protein BIW11_05780 [Tropilaelaps mercedesae]
MSLQIKRALWPVDPIDAMAKTINDLREGRVVAGDCKSDSLPPKWLDFDKYKRGQELLRDNIFAALFCHAGGLMMLVNIPSIHKPLASTCNSSSLVACFQRYLQTLIHVRTWYETDIFDEKSEGFRSITHVRCLHRKIAAAMEQQHAGDDKKIGQRRNSSEDPSKLITDPDVWVSQWDMVVTQFAFLGLMILYPNTLGFTHLSRQDKEAVAYCWRCIGYQLGIDDKYNLFTSDDLHTIEELCQSIKTEVFLPSLTANWPDGLHMGKLILESIRNIVCGLTYNGFAKFWSEVLGIRYLVRLSPADWLSYFLISFAFRTRIFSRKPLRTGLNRLLMHSVDRTSRRSMTIYKDLCVRDNKGGIQVPSCPFAAHTLSTG